MRASDASGRRDEERATKGFKVSAEDDSSTDDVGRNKRKRSRSHHTFPIASSFANQNR